MELHDKNIVLGVTGGVAAYKACELVRQLTAQGASVQVVMSEAATRFVTPVTFQALSGKPVFVDQWDSRPADNMAHIGLTRQADLVLVAPASADFLARVAQGLANDLLTTLVLARDCPLQVAPAMNRQMWENPATQRNVAQLQADDIAVLGPGEGEQACGEVGVGRMLEPAQIVEGVIAFFQPKVLAGQRVLMTVGPTFEAIDPVRGITNHSSGKMGMALARAARDAGANVTAVCGPVAVATPDGIKRIDVTSAREMHAAVMAQASTQDVFIGVAAVADYRPAQQAEQKIKKDALGDAAPRIELVRNPDILADVAALPGAPYCVGFAAESEHLDAYATAKRENKGIPLIVANRIQDGFGGDHNVLVLFDAAGRHELPPASKIALSRQLVAEIAARRPKP